MANPSKINPEQRRQELLAALREEGADEEALYLATNALSAPAPTVASAPTPPPLPNTVAAIRAAISHTFTIAPSLTSESAGEPEQIGPVNATERDAILANSQIVMIAGRNRLRLTDEARADLIQRVADSTEFSQLLAAAIATDASHFEQVANDAVLLPAAWLRSFLGGAAGDLLRAPPSELRAAFEALERLKYVKLPGRALPSVTDVRRLLERSELIEPLRVLIGSSSGWEGTDPNDRFVGREKQIRQLRGFVDELGSRGALETLNRFVGRSISAAQRFFGVRDESVCFLIARGGLGKSALMAKFVLDHALQQSRPFPFVYLDFDRPSLHPREPRQLLVEMARQVGLQFPEVEPQLKALRQRLTQELTSGAADTQYLDPFAEFRSLVQDRITYGDRAFLVVLDTMEIVQYDPKSLSGVVEFISRLDGNPSGNAFGELKVVAAGRADIPELRTSAKQRSDNRRLSLPPFDVDEARQMADRVGRALLRSEWREEWAALIVGTAEDEAERREPLTIRVAVELLRGAKAEERPGLAEEIAREGERTRGQWFVAKLYETRILHHVQNQYARRLAWPGLVVRHVTREIIREKLADLCGLDAQLADLAFDALGNEVWMVDRVGDELWHRADLRARTLPLMKLRAPEKFAAVNRAAMDYFGARRMASAAANAEWVYHRLLGLEPPERVDPDWQDDMATYLAGAADDFERKSPQRSYLLSRTAIRLLAPEQIRHLSPRLALDHLARTAEQLGSFDDVKVEPVLADVSVRVASPGVSSSRPHAVRDIVLIKTGRWDADLQYVGATDGWGVHADFAYRYRRARTVADHEDTGANARLGWVDESAPLRTLVQDLAYARLSKRSMAAVLESRLVATLRGPAVIAGHADLAAVRLAAVFSPEAAGLAARAWLAGVESVRWTLSEPTVSVAELRALFQGGAAARSVLKNTLSELLPDIEMSWSGLLQSVRDPLAQPGYIAHPTVRKVLTSVLNLLADENGPEAIQTLRYFFAARDDDWIVPMGYAAARDTPRRDRTEELETRFASHSLRGSGLLFSRRPRRRIPDDPLQLLRSADDASDILGVAHIFANAGGVDTDDLRSLLLCHTTWRERIQVMLDSEGDEPEAPPRAGPVLHKEDCQKGRWGGRDERDGRRLEAVLGDVDKNDFDVTLIVRSTDDSLLEGPVVFHLHDTYPRQRVWIRKIRDDTWASLEEVNAYEVFTVGAQVKTRSGRWTALELDLATLPKLPKRFLG